MVLLAGAEKAGKSWAAAEATGHPLIRDAYWLGIGEDDPDEYAQVPGADFSIIEHDGTFRAILGQLNALLDHERENPPQDGRADLLIVDSMGRLWAQLSDMAQAEANVREARKAAKYNRPAPDDDVQIGMDLWNRATGRWNAALDLLREFPGPVIVTARLSVVTVLDRDGKPTKDKMDKVEAQKNLPYDAAAVVKMHARGQALLEGVRSAKLQLDRPTRLKDFSVANLWEAMGVGEGMAQRSHTPQSVVTPEQQDEQQQQAPQEQAPAQAPPAQQAPAPQQQQPPAAPAAPAQQEVPPQQAPAAPDTGGQWLDAVAKVNTVAELLQLWHQAGKAGALTPGMKAAMTQRKVDIDAQAQPALEGEVQPPAPEEDR